LQMCPGQARAVVFAKESPRSILWTPYFIGLAECDFSEKPAIYMIVRP
jgi:hypothetical protein